MHLDNGLHSESEAAEGFGTHLGCLPLSGYCASVQQSKHVSLCTKISNLQLYPPGHTSGLMQHHSPRPPKHTHPRVAEEEAAMNGGHVITHSLSPAQRSKRQTKTLSASRRSALPLRHQRSHVFHKLNCISIIGN